jgi:hypothetical protein
MYSFLPINIKCLVSVQNIKRIHKRFQKLDIYEKGYVSPTDFCAIPELEKNNLGTN